MAPALPAADAYQACTSPARLSNLTDGNYLYAGECHGDLRKLSGAVWVAAHSSAAWCEASLMQLSFRIGMQLTSWCVQKQHADGACTGPLLHHLTHLSVPCCCPPCCAVYAVDPVGNMGQPAAVNLTVDNTPPTFTSIK